MSTLGKIRCDICLHIADLEQYNGTANLRTPTGWASVNTQIRISGLSREVRERRKVDKDLQAKIKERVAKKFPTIHMCPGCLSNHFVNDTGYTPLVLASGKMNPHTSAPPPPERQV